MGTAAVGVLMICVGTFLVCRALKIRPTLPMLLVVAALFATGLASMSSVPIAAQLADAKEDLDHWTDEQTALAPQHHRQAAP